MELPPAVNVTLGSLVGRGCRPHSMCSPWGGLWGRKGTYSPLLSPDLLQRPSYLLDKRHPRYAILASSIFSTMADRRPSTVGRNAAVGERSLSIANQVEEQQSWLERKLKPKKITARYPIKGAPLLFATCAFGSLGDALFGYNSGATPL